MYTYRSIAIKCLESAENHAEDPIKQRICKLKGISWAYLFNCFHLGIEPDPRFYERMNSIGRKIYLGEDLDKVEIFLNLNHREIITMMEICDTEKYRESYVDDSGNMIDYTYVPGSIGIVRQE